MKGLIALSGGMDSSTLLAWCLKNGIDEMDCIGFYYGSKHNQYELAAAKSVADHYGCRFNLMDLTETFKFMQSDLMKTGGAIPEGHYEAKNMSATVVPGRNMIFASILAGIAWSRGISKLYLGVHSGDHAIYPDCRPGFVEAMQDAVDEGTDGKVCLKAPFLNGDKTSIIKWGTNHGVPYEKTRTCYKDQPISCGKCGSCCERREAFANNGLVDPIEYEYTGPLPEKPE